MRARSALVYTVLRLLAFLVPLGILLLFPVFRELPLVAAIFAALIGLSLSLLFLRRPLDRVTGGLAERRAARAAEGRSRRSGAEADADLEDAVVDAATSADAAPERPAAPASTDAASDAEAPAEAQAPEAAGPSPAADDTSGTAPVARSAEGGPAR